MADQVVQIGGHKPGLGGTNRADKWWTDPIIYGAGFFAFVLYTTWAAFQGDHYWVGSGGYGGYLSPFYSPILWTHPAPGAAPPAHAWIGMWPSWMPGFIPKSPALFILVFPLSFRMTCYYYRKFYYRSYFMSPPACAVGGRKHDYRGETRLFIFQNLHRYAMYFAIIFVGILYYDAFQAFFRNGKFGVGVGTIILLINPTLIGAYTFGCHSFRHAIGGKMDCYSGGGTDELRHKMWKGCTVLNEKHQKWAWASLLWVAWTDIYIRLVSTGVFTDYNTW